VNIAIISILRLLLLGAFGLLLCLCVSIQTACAINNKKTVLHSFEFDARWDSPDIEILDYRYGEARHPGVRPADHQIRNGEVPQASGAGGYLQRGDDLYVKWSIKSTGEVHEDTVDLKSKLPDDITGHRIRFIVQGSQLYVYLVLPKRKDGCPDNNSSAALQCISEAVARNGGVAVGCPPRKEQLCRIMEPCPSADLRIVSKYCAKEIVRIYPGQPEPLKIEFK